MKSLLTFLTIVGVGWGVVCQAYARPAMVRNASSGLAVATSGACAGIDGRMGNAHGGAKPRAASMQVPAAANPANSQPLTQQQVLELVTAHLPQPRIEELLHSRGVDFQVDDAFLNSLRKAGASDALIASLREAAARTAGLLVETSPNAQVFLDGKPAGQADAQGVLSFRAKLGSHTVKVSLAGKQDFQQTVDVVEKQSTRVVAPLADLAGSLRVQAPSGAAVWLDNSPRGTVDASGQLLLTGIPPGTHSVRIAASGKVDDARSIAVTAGGQTAITATLADSVQVNPQDGLRYVWIAPGSFPMGCSPGDADCAPPEKPAHPVTLTSAYWIGQTEVTVGAYKHYVQVAKAEMPQAPKIDKGWKNSRLPMVNATWQEASQYCTWAGGRLPTEAEWEYAARGGNPQARYGNLNDIAWSKDNAHQTQPVAGKAPNHYGLYDMLGNVWEWVNDWFDADAYSGAAVQDPTGPSSGAEKVLRGGSWIVDTKLLRASDRYSIKPDARSDYFGFRCVWTPKTP